MVAHQPHVCRHAYLPAELKSFDIDNHYGEKALERVLKVGCWGQLSGCCGCCATLACRGAAWQAFAGEVFGIESCASGQGWLMTCV